MRFLIGGYTVRKVIELISNVHIMILGEDLPVSGSTENWLSPTQDRHSSVTFVMTRLVKGSRPKDLLFLRKIKCIRWSDTLNFYRFP